MDKMEQQTRQTKPLKEVVQYLLKEDSNTTLLGIGPMSDNVIRASLEVGKEDDCPVMFIASRNQIECEQFGKGYVMNWDQKQFASRIKELAVEVGFIGPLYICRDHGGPWHLDKEMREKLPEQEAMERAKISYLEDLKAGFNVIHVDPTKDPNYEVVPLNLVINRTIELIEFIEQKRKELGIQHIDYEVGTEETNGGLTDYASFEKFIQDLLKGLDEKNLPHPSFIVGQTGTLLKMKENVGKFNPEQAKRLAEIARKYGIGLKEHNSDYLPYKDLKMHPELKVTAINVAPEFAHYETAAYIKLARECGDNWFIRQMKKSVIDSGRWKKWLVDQDKDLDAENIKLDYIMFDDILTINGHYVYSEDNIKKAIEELYENAKKVSKDPKKDVIESVKGSIRRYVNSLNLKGLNSRLSG